MNKKLTFLLSAGAFLLGAALQAQMKIGRWEAGPQIVFIVNQTLSTGEWVLIAPEQVPVFTVHGSEGSHLAPLSPGTQKICRMLYNYRNSENRIALAFSCGSDEVVTTDVSLLDRKDAKKYVGETIPRGR